MELSSLDRFNSTHQAFLDQLTESIGIVLNTIEANTRTENLLKQSQSLTIELQKGQQELQKTNQELAGKSALQSRERSVPRHAEPRIADAAYPGDRFHHRALEGEEGLPEHIQESLHMIRRNVELEARLIDDLLDLTRISRGKVQLNFEVVDAHSLLQNALEICQSEIERKHLTLRLDLAAQKVHLRADPARLQQIFWNIIKNAVKFTPENGQIHISTSNDSDEQLHVEIVDTGLGIESETLPKIFDAFEQGTRKSFGGLGLGLAISKTLVEAHKGSITAESAVAIRVPGSVSLFRPAPSRAGTLCRWLGARLPSGKACGFCSWRITKTPTNRSPSCCGDVDTTCSPPRAFTQHSI